VDELLRGVVDWLDTLSVHATIRDAGWIVPAVQSIHIACVALVFTGALIVALRGLELAGGHWSLARWSRYFHGSTVTALWILLATGLVMIVAEPERELMNWVFRTKMLLVVITLVIAGALGRQLRRSAGDRPANGVVRLVALLVVLLWIGVAMAGRWIAYAG